MTLDTVGLLMGKLAGCKLGEKAVAIFMSDNGMTDGGSCEPGIAK